MGGDYTRFTFDARKNHAGVLKQQGRVSLDADWNELAEVEDRRWRSETIDIIGQCVVPATTPNAFGVIPTGSGTFDIGIGRSYVDGIQAECHGLDPQVYDSILGETRGTSPVPYGDQPHYPAPLPPALGTPSPVGRTDLIYIDVWQREVTVVEDPDLKEIALGGPDTTTRIQTAWQVKALEGVGDVACPHTIAEWDALTRPSAGRLTTATYVPPPDDNPCSIAAAGGYRGLENRLYRLEIHTPGGLGTATFKWSRNNASIVSSVTAISASGDQITVESIGRDDILRFSVGDWVEITDDHLEFQHQPGHMGRITDIDEANNLITIDNTGLTTLSMDPADSERHTRIRRWDQSAEVDANGLMSVPALATDTVDIELGIEVSFDLDTAIAGGEFKVGDYWVFHARTADGSVALLDHAPPRGIKHHYCRLALVTWGATAETTIVRDCRTIWPPLSCCPITVRPGEDIQAAIDRVPEDGGCVCLLPGIHRIYRPLFIDGRQNLTITGVGPATKVVFTPLETPEVQDLAMLYVTGTSRSIEIRNFLMHADTLRHMIFVDQASEDVFLQALTIINGFEVVRMRATSTDGVLLGECCQINASGCRVLAFNGIVQADQDTLTNARKALALVRPVDELPAGDDDGTDENIEEDDAEDTEPAEVATIRNLEVRDCELYAARVGVSLQDVLGGGMLKNSLRGIRIDNLLPFKRHPVKAVDHAGAYSPNVGNEAFYLELDDKLIFFSPCHKPDAVEEEHPAEPLTEAHTDVSAAETISDGRRSADHHARSSGKSKGRVLDGSMEGSVNIPKDSIGAYGAMLENFRFNDNCMKTEIGIAIEYGRSIMIRGNHLKFSRVGVGILYGFDASMEDNVMRQVVTDGFQFEKSNSSFQESLKQRFRPGSMAVLLRFARGLKVNRNTIDCLSAVGLQRSDGMAKKLRKYSLLRILRIEHLFRVVVELTWFFYQIFQLFSSAGSGGSVADDPIQDQSLKDAFEDRVFGWLMNLLAGNIEFGFVGKAEISDNRMQVSRFGIFFYNIITIGGLRIARNRISGFRNVGILAHPWFSFGPVDRYARWARCLITWFILFIRMLRDALKDFLEETDTSGQPPEGIPAGVFGAMTLVISWIMVLCSKYCGDSRPPGEEGEDEEQPPTLVEVLKGSLDEFLDRVNPAWIDDLVNQSYSIDANTLGGSGDGIRTGVESSRITNNKVSIWPQSTVPRETVIFGAMLKDAFEGSDTSTGNSGYIVFVGDTMMDLDRDMLLFLSFGETRRASDAPLIDEPAIRDAFAGALNQLLPHLQPASALHEPVTHMQDALNATPPDLPGFQQSWVKALNAINLHMFGFGISMLGGNMVCDENQIVSHAGCSNQSSSQKNDSTFFNFSLYRPAAAVHPGRLISVIPSSGIGGIYQFSNMTSLMTDMARLFLSGDKLGDKMKVKLYEIVVALLVLVALFLERDRRITISENHVDDALVHGIRTLPAFGFTEIDILDNFVRNASRCGLYHSSTLLTSFVDDLHLKIHRNTPTRSRDSSVFQFLTGQITDFAALILARNGEEGTMLMSNNHGDGEDLSGESGRAVIVESDVVGIMANHILTNAARAFEVTASRGLFTDNITNQPNDFLGADVSEAPNIEIS